MTYVHAKGVGAPAYRTFMVVSACVHVLVLAFLPSETVEFLSRGMGDTPGVAGDDPHLPASFERTALRVIELETASARSAVIEVPPIEPRPEPESKPPTETVEPETPVEIEVDDTLSEEVEESDRQGGAPTPVLMDAPAGAPQPTGGLAVGSGADDPDAVVVPPVLVGVVWPEAPKEARRRGTAPIELEVHVLASGKVGEVRVAKPTGCKPCEDAALQAARRLRFRPARRGDQPIDAWVSYTVSFKR